MEVTKKSELMHYGVLGMKWGVRRFQNFDGSLTAAGRKRYMKDGQFTEEGRDSYRKDFSKLVRSASKNGKYSEDWNKLKDSKQIELSAKSKTMEKLNKNYNSTGKRLSKVEKRYSTIQRNR